MKKLVVHPTLYAACFLLKQNPKEVIRQAYEWAEQIPEDEIRWMEIMFTHFIRGKMSAIVHGYCLSVLNGWAEPLPKQKMIGGGDVEEKR